MGTGGTRFARFPRPGEVWTRIDPFAPSGGEMLTVTERKIGVSLKEMGRRGHFIEPTSAATLAGLRNYLKKKNKEGIVISTLTGSGLKATEKIGHP